MGIWGQVQVSQGGGIEGTSRSVEIVILLHVLHDVSKLPPLLYVQSLNVWIDSCPF